MGRPREFEPKEALEKAMLQFWAKGFHDTSIRDLIDRTGVNQYGLYGVFENKRQLYLAALDHYQNAVTREALKQLEGPGPIAQRIEALFAWLRGRMQTPDGPFGCLICNAAIEMAPSLCKSPVFVVRSSDLGQDKDVDAISEFLTTTAYSLGFLLRAGCDRDYLRRHLRTALAILR